ncbi:hypothetical protein [Streptomyces decoyicus]|uniref:hypothetical protein n=1 Tax=Streptomyces decoyicus TaxID=249567 RepID=UPI0038134511
MAEFDDLLHVEGIGSELDYQVADHRAERFLNRSQGGTDNLLDVLPPDLVDDAAYGEAGGLPKAEAAAVTDRPEAGLNRSTSCAAHRPPRCAAGPCLRRHRLVRSQTGRVMRKASAAAPGKVKIISTYSTRLRPDEVVCAARKHPEVIKWSSPKRNVCGDPDDVMGDTHLIQKYRIHNVMLKWSPKKSGEFVLEQTEGYFYCEKGDDDKQYCHEGDWDVVR